MQKKFAKNLKVVYQNRNATEYNNHDGRWRLKEKNTTKNMAKTKHKHPVSTDK